MRTVQFLGDGKVTIAEVPRPVADSESVIVRVKASGICGSEMHLFNASRETIGQLHNAGHEVVGVIEEAPAGCGFRPGQRVGARIVQGCGKCRYCLAGDETGCPQKRFFAPDGHSEYFKLGLQGVHVLPDDVDWPAGVLLAGDGLGVPVRCATRLGDTAGKKVLVLGLGPVGLSCVLVQSFKGAKVMGADVSAYRLKLARGLGAEDAVNVKEDDLKARVSDWTEGVGADIVILAVARNESLAAACDVVRRHGVVFQVAELAEATLNFGDVLLRKEATLAGSWYFTSSDWPEMLKMHSDGLPYGKLITHTFPFERAQEAYDLMQSARSGKIVLTYK